MIGRDPAAFAVDAEPGRGIALRIEIEDEHLLADGRKRGSQVDRRCGLADAALLVGEHQNARLGRTRSCFGSAAIAHHEWLSMEVMRRILASESVRLGRMSAVNVHLFRASVNSISASRPLGKTPIVPAFSNGSVHSSSRGSAARARAETTSAFPVKPGMTVSSRASWIVADTPARRGEWRGEGHFAGF